MLNEIGDVEEELNPQKNVLLQKKENQRAFLRGAFLTAGSMTDPEKSYHFEIACATREKAEQIQKLMRAGRVDHPGHLFIGTLYSQYADRRTTLSGEVTIDPKGLSSYVDAAQGKDVRFIMSGEEINVKEDVSDATFIEIRPDEYEGKEE